MVKVGDTFLTKRCGICTVIEYVSYVEVYVKFEDGNIVKTRVQSLGKGHCRNLNSKLVLGVGINDMLGAEKTKEFIKQRQMWFGVLQRCFSIKLLERRPTYKNCKVSESWLWLSNFIKDIKSIENYEKSLNEGWQLDKDLLSNEGKLYSKDTCCFIPRSLNLVISSYPKKLNGLPKGVKLSKGGRYFAILQKEGNQIFLGSYDSVEEASRVYNIAKKEHLLNIADSIKDIVPENVYKALVNFNLEKL
jgi:hypothetical protein